MRWKAWKFLVKYLCNRSTLIYYAGDVSYHKGLLHISLLQHPLLAECFPDT